MIKARQTPFFVRFFNWYSRRMIKTHFHEVRFHNKPEKTDSPLLVIANHFSWWDGFFIVYYNRLFFKKKFFVMMLEEQLKNRLFLNKAGAFSIKKNAPSAIDSLKYAGELISDPEHLLLMFPQGRIQSQHLCSFQFEKGIEIILRNSSLQPEILFVANITEYYSQKKPSLDVYFEKPDISSKNYEQIESLYNSFFSSCIKQQKPEEL